MYNDYPNAGWIKDNSKAKEWLKEYLSVNITCDHGDIKAVAYMMDTNVWEIYEGMNAEYAMAGPTIELFCASYKDTHPDNYIEYRVENNLFYYVKFKNDASYQPQELKGLSKDEYNGIYIKSDKSKADGMFIASPASSAPLSYIWGTYYDGRLKFTFCGGSSSQSFPGSRPIVCLKFEVKLEKQSDGIYSIIE